MKFHVMGMLNGKAVRLAWSDSVVSGDKEAVQAFNELCKQYEQKGGFGPPPADMEKDFAQSKYLSYLLFDQVLQNMRVTTGQDVVKEMLEEPPEGSIF